MKKRSISLAVIVALVVGCAEDKEISRTQPTPETILLVNANIVTMNPQQPSAEAMAVSGDRILAIGSEKEVRSKIGAYEKFYDLKGKTVVPGFVETHDHLFMSSNQLTVTDVSP
ncbi:MAG: hypothetical protein ACYTFQ_14550, partial [Planctomycetota bacterium]